MALIDCPECSKKISEKAPSCPHCGVAFQTAVEVEKISRYTNKKSDEKIYFSNKRIKNRNSPFLKRLFTISHWSSVIIGIGLILLLTLALGTSSSPKPYNYEQFVGIMIFFSCILPLTVTGVFHIGLYLFNLDLVSFKFRKYWINSFAPSLVTLSIASIGYGLSEYKLAKDKLNQRPPSIFDNIDDEDNLNTGQNESRDYPPYSEDILFSSNQNVYDPINNKFIKKDGYPAINGILLRANNSVLGIINKINRFDGSIEISHIYDYNDTHFVKTLNYEQIDIRRSIFYNKNMKKYDGNEITFKCMETGDLIEVREGGDWKFKAKIGENNLFYNPDIIKAIQNDKLVELFSYISFGAERIKAQSDPKWKSYHNQRLSK